MHNEFEKEFMKFSQYIKNLNKGFIDLWDCEINQYTALKQELEKFKNHDKYERVKADVESMLAFLSVFKEKTEKEGCFFSCLDLFGKQEKKLKESIAQIEGLEIPDIE